MCTLSVLARSRGYHLWFNRDELKSRAPEAPPEVHLSGKGTRHAFPRDGKSGGTWLMLNAHGLTALVLNDYEADSASLPGPSRGMLPLACADARTSDEAVEAVEDLLGKIGPAAFPPFRFLAVEAAGVSLGIHWNGKQRVQLRNPDFLTSSSRSPSLIQAGRAARHSAIQKTPDALRAFHWSHDPSDGAGSVRMQRDDASTRSILEVTVMDGASPRLIYWPLEWSSGCDFGRMPCVEVSP